ncbi:TetR/AcrR family transcriptional regulator [Pollutimonas bauzanensis]|uniref:Transcriptional regulator, TetR family n=1 Tax=Pollutimonas bauzanensis TaxID=658167 RepID=A0A1M6B976_9BURK|nr:TetR/AcrR family transcriptional regulator [Pollutimonas bauzanensis]SHI45290.1 transcriptional regulator, TetR family [Pollutimonas bauzanensis]
MTLSRSSTRNTILDAAEQLFAQQGHDNTSMRQITAAAGVNLSAVNYHFGSKDGLVHAVFERRLTALNQERLALLDELENEAQGQPLKPSLIVEAFFGPLVRHASGASPGEKAFVPLLERSMSDPGGFIRSMFVDEHTGVIERFKHALLKSLPDVPEEEIVWRFHFMLGATSYAISGTEVLRLAMGWPEPEPGDGDGAQKLLARLMSFLLGGLRAPLPGATAPLPHGRHEYGAAKAPANRNPS